MAARETRPLAIVTGASTGIGFELAKCCATDGYDLVVCANEPEIENAAAKLKTDGGSVQAVRADLASEDGVESLWTAVKDRPIEILVANAGRGLGDAFLDQDFEAAKALIDLNVTGTLLLLHKAGRQMRQRGKGRILIVGSVAGFIPGSYMAVYNGTKAFLDNFAYALRNELKDSGVTVTCLMPGATETEFFRRAGMLDTPLGEDEDKDDPADVAREGYKAMQKGEAGVVTGWMNKIQTALASIVPDTMLAEIQRKKAQPRR